MRAGDLKRAQGLVEKRDSLRRMKQRLDAEPLRLMVGDGSTASIIELSPSYLGRVTVDIAKDLDLAVAQAERELFEMGVEI